MRSMATVVPICLTGNGHRPAREGRDIKTTIVSRLTHLNAKRNRAGVAGLPNGRPATGRWLSLAACPSSAKVPWITRGAWVTGRAP